MPAQDPFIFYSVNCFYHFTDVQNLESIRDCGGLYSLDTLRQNGIEIRAPGGNEWSHDADELKGLDKYVHLCFRPNHPMEYVARQDGRIASPIYLQVHPDVLHIEGVMFAADVSNKSGVTVLPIAEALSIIDFPVLYTRTDWTDPDVQLRLRQAEKYELLVPNHVPMRLIRNLPNG